MAESRKSQRLGPHDPGFILLSEIFCNEIKLNRGNLGEEQVLECECN